jgi:HEPN domain-containing protein
MPALVQSGEIARTAGQWLRWADQDYVAARTLLLKGLLVQGCGLANTAVEKYFKAVLVISGSSFPRGFQGHDVVHLYEKLLSAGIDRGLNMDFLRMLVKAYRMRYPDDLEHGFNIVLQRVKILAELDATVHAIRKGFQFRQQGGDRANSLEALVEKKNEQLLDRNHIYGSERAELFAGATMVYEARVLRSGILEVEYEAQRVTDDGQFDIEGLKPNRT